MTATHSPPNSIAAADSTREMYARLALPYIPRLLQLVDRNPFSRTYGCFDRAYWHYRTMDFPCGMSQEFVLPLALVYAKKYPGNTFHGVARVRELAEAGVRYMIQASHADGTTDDYFPFERAMGALVFSLYACAETYRVLGMNDPKVVELFSKRVVHLDHENETGQLTNHQAFAALAAYTVFQITGDDKQRRVAEDRVALTLKWQNQSEGWFQEYEGADPGYHTCTIDFLAKYMQKSGATALREPLKKACDFAANFMHPDGSYAGEYGSRNTYHFYPHGFEVMGPHSSSARFIADGFLRGAPHGKRYINADDRMTAHYVYNFLQAYEDFAPRTGAPARPERTPATVWMPGAKMAVKRADPDAAATYHAVANLAKGGAIKIFDAAGPIASDTGITASLADGRTVVSHLMMNDAEVKADATTGVFSVKSVLCRRRHNLPTPFKNMVFRGLLLTIGRFNANLTRSMLQKILITGKPPTPFRFERRIEYKPDRVVVEDRIEATAPITRLAVGADGTSIYVANSNVYQESVLCPWQFADWNALPVKDGFKVWTREYFRGSGHSPHVGGAS